MKKYIIILLFFLTSFLSFSQGTEMNKEIITVDKDLLDNIQLLHPDFFFSNDSVVLYNNLLKFYINEKMSADDSLKDKLVIDSLIIKRREQFLKMADDFFWYNILIDKQNEIPITINEKELHSYYENNLTKFNKPYTFSFWQAWITTDNEKTQAIAKSKLLNMSKVLPDPHDENSKYSEENFAINFEFPCQYSKGYPLYQFLVSAKINELTGPIKVNNSTVFIVIKNRTGGEIKPFDEVKAQCESEIMQMKIQETERKRMDLIKNKYKIIISEELNNK